MEHELVGKWAGQTLRHRVLVPDHSNGRLVAILHEAFGISDHAVRRARMLQAAGYHAVIVDMFAGVRPKTLAEAGHVLATVYNEDLSVLDIVRDAVAACTRSFGPFIDWSAVGFCFGGTIALELGRAGQNLSRAVCIHGRLSSLVSPGQPLKTSMLVITGALDPMVPSTMRDAFVGEMVENNADWQMLLLGTAFHAFTDPDAGHHGMPGVQFDALADKRAWAATRAFLDDTNAT